MIRTDDPIRDFNQYDTEEYLKTKSLPICCDCGNTILGEYYWDFHGYYYCEDCVREHRERIDDLYGQF